jgi:hypothetical protein
MKIEIIITEPIGTRIRNGYISSGDPVNEIQKMIHPLQVDIVK